MKLLEAAKMAGLSEKKYVCEEDENVKIVAYTSWETELLGGKRIDTREQAAPLLYMMQKAVPSSTISEFFVDTLGTRRTDRRKEWKNLIEYCKTNKVDYIIIPSFDSYSKCIPEVLQMTRELKRMDNMPKVFFVLECASSDADNFEMMLTFEATIRAEEDRIQQKKKKLLADIKEGEKAMREDDSYSDFFLFLLTSEMMEMERRKKSIQRKKRKEAIPEDVKEGAKQLREWNRIARKKEKLSQQQK